MIKANINSKEVRIPISWGEMTFGQFLATLRAGQDTIAILAIFLDVPRETLLKAKIIGLEKILIALNFMKTEMLYDEQPTKVGPYKLPKDITLESVEQLEFLSLEIKKANESNDLYIKTEALARYCAIYVQGMKEDFDYEKAMYMVEELKGYPAVEIMSAGRFFLAKMIHLETGLEMNFLISLTQKKKSKPDSKASTKHSASTRHSTK